MSLFNTRSVIYKSLSLISTLVAILFFSFPSQTIAVSASRSNILPPVVFTAARRTVEPPFDPSGHLQNPDGLTANLVMSDIGVNAPLIYSKYTDVQTADWNCLKSYRQCPMRFLLRYGILHIFGTPQPGELGNSILVGHSSCYSVEKTQYCKVLQKLNTLPTTSRFTIEYSNGKKQTYEIFDSFRFYYSRAKRLATLSDQITNKQRQVDTARNSRSKATFQRQLNSLQAQYDRLNKGANFDKRNAKFPNERVITLETCWPLGTALDRWVVQARLVDETMPNTDTSTSTN